MRTNIRWTQNLVNKFRAYSEERTEQSITQRCRGFARANGLSYYSAKTAYYKYLVRNEQTPDTKGWTNLNLFDVVTETPKNTRNTSPTITFAEAIEAIRFARQNGYTLSN